MIQLIPHYWGGGGFPHLRRGTEEMQNITFLVCVLTVFLWVCWKPHSEALGVHAAFVPPLGFNNYVYSCFTDWNLEYVILEWTVIRPNGKAGSKWLSVNLSWVICSRKSNWCIIVFWSILRCCACRRCGVDSYTNSEQMSGTVQSCLVVCLQPVGAFMPRTVTTIYARRSKVWP